MHQSKAKSLARSLYLCVLILGVSSVCSAKGRAEALQAAPLPNVASVDWALQVPANEPIAIRGVVNFDTAGTGQGTMMYPAPNAVGLLAAIVTHGVIEGSLKRKQREKLQTAANQVLLPYQATLANYSNKEVVLAALTRRPFGDRKNLIAASGTSGNAWRLDCIPRYSFTQDQRSFILDNTIVVTAPGASVPARRTTVRVVSRPRDGDDLVGLWTADQGVALKKELSDLFAESVEVALRALAAKPGDVGAAFETVRYAEGSTEKIERAQPLYKECGRVVLKTLRGTLMSVPARVKPDESTDAETCSTSAGPINNKVGPSHDSVLADKLKLAE